MSACTVCGGLHVARGFCARHYAEIVRGHMPRPTRDLDLASRLEYYSESVAETGCQIWIGSTNAFGYGRIWLKDKVVLAHRVAFEIANGPIPQGAYVLHRCDVPQCINTTHLFLGSFNENMADMVRKGRQQKGERHAHAKLNTEKVLAIRSDQRPQRTIATEFGICQQNVSMIKRRERWSEISQS